MSGTEYGTGEIDRLLQSAHEAPPVHPHLIEHLREKFSLRLPTHPSGIHPAEHSLVWVSTRQGEQAVINYLETLVNTGQGLSSQKDIAHELSPSPRPENPGTDPRRPYSGRRG